MANPREIGAPWWQSGVLYQIYPRSFADSNGDGAGDLRGIIEHLDHLEDLGVDGMWLSPVTVSPNRDWGYDVADFCAIEPDFGTLADVEELVAKAGERGIRVLMDFVPNHTSDQHPWFIDSRSSRDAKHRDWYVWADAKEDGSLPNNWISSFGGPAWTLDAPTGQYYLHNHLNSQPDLNWWNEEVRAEFDRILRFWFDLGIAGFRIDVCHIIVKDALLRDNPPATDRDTGEEQLYGQKWLYNANRPEVHDVLRHWREIANEYDPPRVFVGETPVDDFAQLAAFYGQGDELQLAFNFAFIAAPLTADAMRPIAEAVEAALPADAWPAWTGSNHDMARLSSRWANNDPRAVRAALLMMLTLRGTPVLYQGDEIGLGDVEVVPPYLRDPLGVAYYPAYAGRDSARTPMQWRDAPGGGFTDDDVTPWLPLGDTAARNVADQVDDPASILTFVRAVIACRRATPTLQLGSYETLPGPDGAWAWRRGNDHVVAVNLGENAITIDLGAGAILIGTELARIGESVDGLVALGPWEGVVLTTA